MSAVPLPPAEQLEPALWSLPVPMPIRPLRYVLVYVFDTPEAWEHLTEGLPI